MIGGLELGVFFVAVRWGCRKDCSYPPLPNPELPSAPFRPTLCKPPSLSLLYHAKKTLTAKAVDDLGNLVAMCELLPTDPAPRPLFRSAGGPVRCKVRSLGLGSPGMFLFCVWMFGLTGVSELQD